MRNEEQVSRARIAFLKMGFEWHVLTKKYCKFCNTSSFEGANVRGLRAVEGKRQRAVEDGKGLVFDRFGVALGVGVELIGHDCGSEDALLAW